MWRCKIRVRNECGAGLGGEHVRWDDERPEVDVREREGDGAYGRGGVLGDVGDLDVVELPLQDLYGDVLYDAELACAIREEEQAHTGRDRMRRLIPRRTGDRSR